MEVQKLSLVATTECSCCDPQNNIQQRKSLDDYISNTLTITSFDNNTENTENKQTENIYIPTYGSK